MQPQKIADENLVAYCGLYCGACSVYLKGKCPGCLDNDKADKWCKVRSCCQENEYGTCAECEKVESTTQCKKLNNIVSKMFSLLFGSNRNACIKRVKEIGIEQYAKEMSEKKKATIK